MSRTPITNAAALAVRTGARPQPPVAVPPSFRLMQREQVARMTKHQIQERLFSRTLSMSDTYLDCNGVVHRGILQSLLREDGSGHNFMVTLATRDGMDTFFMRTLD